VQRPHRRAHARIWSALIVLLPLVLIAALLMRQSGPGDPPVRLSASQGNPG
jgi:hypothetical protein